MATTQEFSISDTLWTRLEPLLPVQVPKPHPLGRHRRRIADRQVLNGIFFVLRTGCQWKALDATGLCKGSTAHSRFQQWVRAGVFAHLWDEASPIRGSIASATCSPAGPKSRKTTSPCSTLLARELPGIIA